MHRKNIAHLAVAAFVMIVMFLTALFSVIVLNPVHDAVDVNGDFVEFVAREIESYADGEQEMPQETPEQDAPTAPEPVDKPAPAALQENQPQPTSEEQRIDGIISSMSVEQKAAALFMVAPEDITGGEAVTSPDQIADALRVCPVSGICWFSKNIEDPAQLSGLLAGASDISREVTGSGLLDAVDEEGGLVSRVADTPAFGIANIGSMRDLGGSPDAARESGAIIGGYLKPLGFEMDFAPVCDASSSEYDVMYYRAFSGDTSVCAQCSAAFIDGLSSAGVAGCLKHFPGIGEASGGDSHENAIENYGTREEILSGGASAFRDAMAIGKVPSVMVGHLSCPAVDPENPASLSHEVISGMLRGELGYDGVVFTDSCQMGAISNNYDSYDVGVLAIEAGADIILMPMDFAASYQGVVDAISSGRLSTERVDESLRRILKLKMELGCL